MKELIFLLSADIDIQQAYGRYEDVQEGRGDCFLAELDGCFGLLKNNPKLGRRFDGPFRRLLLRDFPFGIFYEEETARIVVLGVMDLRQDPAHIQRRLRP